MKEKSERSLFGFLARGVTTTHPLCSVFMLLICFIFCFTCVEVKALDFPLPVPAVPINPYSTESLEPDFELLNDDQKKIAEEILGINSTVFFGLGYWPYTAQTIGNSLTREKLQEVGRTFVNTFMSSVLGSPRAMQDLVGSVTQKASTYEDYDDYVADTTTIANGGVRDRYYLEFPWELTIAYKNWFAIHGGVEDWQTSVQPFSTSFEWNYMQLSESIQIAYDYALDNLPDYHAKANYNTSYPTYNCYISLPQQYYLFFNTSSNLCSVVDDNGNIVDLYNRPGVLIEAYHNPVRPQNSTFSVIRSTTVSTNSLTGSSYVDKARYVFNNFSLLMYGYYSDNMDLFFDPTSVISHVYVGADWAGKHELFNVEDLDIGQATSNYIDNVGDTMYVDATGIIDDLAEGVSDTNQLVRDNTLVRDNDRAIPYADVIVKAVDKYMSTPESGVVISPSLFQSLGKYITYLYEQTKPLILFTQDLFKAFTFDGTGLSWVVYGAVSCGLIGGVLCKFLL